MKITIIGTGYVGLVTGTCLAEIGHTVTCLDVDSKKINMLSKGKSPIYEPLLDHMIQENIIAQRLFFSCDYSTAIPDSEVVFIAVGTPPREDGSADLHYVLGAAKNVAEFLNGYAVVVVKSTVPVGTNKKVREIIKTTLAARGSDIKFDTVSNPEFLREGVAVNDFMKPDRIVIGTDSEMASRIMRNVYETPYSNSQNILQTNIESAEMIKYASNAFLAVKISYINEMSAICEAVGADVREVSKGMGLDHRISKYSLYAGPGYGGSCFPKDTQALIKIARDNDCDVKIVQAAEEANTHQKIRLAKLVTNYFGNDVKSKKIGVLGLAFKPETDDVRESPAIMIINELLNAGAEISAYDPIAVANFANFAPCGEKITYGKNVYDALKNCDALVLVTEWLQFKNMDMKKVARIMKNKVIFDFRNLYDEDYVKSLGFEYFAVGHKTV